LPESRKKQSPELATPKKWQSPGLGTPKKWQSPTLVEADLVQFCTGTGWLILLATPKFPYVPESRKKQSPELATPQKMA
jgi:hypothetical protein